MLTAFIFKKVKQGLKTPTNQPIYLYSEHDFNNHVVVSFEITYEMSVCH